MTSITSIPVKDIKLFLSQNGVSFVSKNEKQMYDDAWNLIQKGAKNYPDSVVEWMIAYNLLQQKVNIRNYHRWDISDLSKEELNNLTQLLTLKVANKERIINILRYLGKLDEDLLNIPLTLNELAENKNKTYKGFIDALIKIAREKFRDLSEEDEDDKEDVDSFAKMIKRQMDRSYYDEVVARDSISIYTPTDYGEDRGEIITIKNAKGITNGEILYKVAKSLPNED